MQVHELGYRKWVVPVRSLLSGWSVIAETGVTLAWRGSWVRRILFFAFLPAIPLAVGFFLFEFGHTNPEVKVAIEYVITSPESWLYQPAAADAFEDGNARHAVWSSMLLYFFRVPQAVAMLLVVGLIAPRLISQDVRSRAFLLYFSRPISIVQYVLGKSAIVWFFIGWITTMPALVMYVAGVFMSPNLSVISSTYDLPFRILAASAVLIIPTTALALCFSSLTTETRNAGFLWFATWIIGWVTYASLAMRDALQNQQPPSIIDVSPEALDELNLSPELRDQLQTLSESKFVNDIARNRRLVERQMHQYLLRENPTYRQIYERKYREQQRKQAEESFANSQWSLFSPYHTLGKVQTWVFGLERDFKKVLPSIVLLTVVTVLAVAILFRRVTAPLRV